MCSQPESCSAAVSDGQIICCWAAAHIHTHTRTRAHAHTHTHIRTDMNCQTWVRQSAACQLHFSNERLDSLKLKFQTHIHPAQYTCRSKGKHELIFEYYDINSGLGVSHMCHLFLKLSSGIISLFIIVGTLEKHIWISHNISKHKYWDVCVNCDNVSVNTITTNR